MSSQPAAAAEHDRLMQANLAQVFSERDAARRILAIAELYQEDAVPYEPLSEAVQGHQGISDTVTRLLADLAEDFAFTATGPVLGHHEVGVLRWEGGPPDGAVAVSGLDVARFQDGQIQSLHVVIQPTV